MVVFPTAPAVELTVPRRPDGGQALFGVLFVALFTTLGIAAWGDAGGFFAHPARLAGVALALLIMLSTAFSGCSGFRRRGRTTSAHRRTVPPIFVVILLMAWLPPYCDRRDLWTLDGDVTRYSGLAIYALGGALRVLPMFVLGRRFSTLLAIQEDHRLETRGLYGIIRHPSYLGGCLMLVGWALLFRSGAGVLLMVPFVLAIAYRIQVEEATLLEEFGDEYRMYQTRTWRLVPFLY
jgi:protein-S-isoprenylcysteine O-methyltransferase Ste14